MTTQITLNFPGNRFYDIRSVLENVVSRTGLSDGVCLVRGAEPGIGLLHGPEGSDGGKDLWDSFARLMDGVCEPAVKAAVGGQALELIIAEGKLLLGQEETVYAAGCGGVQSGKLLVSCFGE